MHSSKLNLASSRFGAKVIRASDDFFADKQRMLQAHDAEFIEGKYDDTGKWMDGWESRRRRDTDHDWAVIKLACPANINEIDLDTRHFTGNYPPAASVEACLCNEEPNDATQWHQIIPATALGPDASHLITTVHNGPWSHLRINLLPDGGIARLRAYGAPAVKWQEQGKKTPIELSGALNGGKIIAYNNAHYGNIDALLYPDSGLNMGDGWETRRRREPGFDWVIIELGHSGMLESIEVDTRHNKGNFPDRFSLNGIATDLKIAEALVAQSIFWPEILSEQPLQADSTHKFGEQDFTANHEVTHLRVNIFPDGGLSRFRANGLLV